MKRCQFYFIVILSALILIIIFFIRTPDKKIEESIIYFPINQLVTYETAKTSINILDYKSDGGYSLFWQVHSALNEKAYLRQDMALLFINGRLKEKMGKWKQNTTEIKQQKKISEKESSHVQAITFHYSEIHEAGEKITSAHTMSAEELYVINSLFSPLLSFKKAATEIERDWEKLLDNMNNELQKQIISKAAKAFSINEKAYHIIPLTDLIKYNHKPLHGFTIKESERIIGQLWEGLYKNYFLGIKKDDGTIIDSLNSTIPLLLFAKDRTHLLIIFESASGESFLLRQTL
ncbi:hypothetical protein H1Z61_01380 [Bacillus aquiflavi]|uniref:DUF3919 family protein n=1 Tax=Bacillus aquiflavi TaxID=2672567 RepID=A0A6B3VXD9_9BACI|nr:hypothetical protein [Bacillus aquiflavi]MBA4535820.1 hypothetical protein [Bacillus aquiflavi]NEY80196.1 hypothetical protein [Bacillus aquiflavi]UAC47247.1 hypothetical protein K6959_10975 [Bacillus aquiflavi]